MATLYESYVGVNVFLGCPEGTYKPDEGNGNCTYCAANSVSNQERTSCQCKDKFYRATGESLSQKCSGTIGKINKLDMLLTDNHVLHIYPSVVLSEKVLNG